jgi:hypothetical protein
MVRDNRHDSAYMFAHIANPVGICENLADDGRSQKWTMWFSRIGLPEPSF